MGTAFALPCIDNNHDTSIVGTHLEDDFIDTLKNNDNHLVNASLEILGGGNKVDVEKENKTKRDTEDIKKFNKIAKSMPEIIGRLPRLCSFCGDSVALKRCSRCKKMFYCSAACQSIQWESHKPYCKP